MRFNLFIRTKIGKKKFFELQKICRKKYGNSRSVSKEIENWIINNDFSDISSNKLILVRPKKEKKEEKNRDIIKKLLFGESI